MANCCQAVNIQFIPDPQVLGTHNLICVSCQSVWGPVNQVPVFEPMLPFEEQVVGKLNALMTAFEVEDNYPSPIAGVDQEGGGVHETAWTNFINTVQASDKKSWAKGAIVTEMGKLIQEAREVELADPEVETADAAQADLPF